MLPAGSAVQRYKADQRRLWDETAPYLRDWWPTFEGFMAPVTCVMIAQAGLYPGGAHVVDVASGFGEPALAVAGRVGPQGHVVATDLSSAMLSVATDRALALGLGNVEFVQMDAEEPTLAQGVYDAVVCRLG